MSRRESQAALGALYCPTCEQEELSGELCPRDGTRLVRLASERDPLVGRKLDDRFTIEEKLGAGGMGSVYRARQHSVGRDVAIKVVNPGLVTDPLATKRFLREAKLASRLAHPNVVSVLDFGQTKDGLFYLVMELVHGRTLHAALLEEGRMKLDRIVRIVGQICDALEGAHALPIMHRDLKPANIMLLSAGRDLVKVLDFGLAKSLAVDATSSTMTSAGAVLGTPTFMPPEVANGEAYDERADLYSLGCILYLLVAGRPPFVTDSVPEMIALHGSAIPDRVANVPHPVAAVIHKLLEKDPSARYPTAGAVRTALEEAVESSRSGALLVGTLDGGVAEVPSIVPASRATVASDDGLPLAFPMRSSEEALTRPRSAVPDPTSVDGPPLRFAVTTPEPTTPTTPQRPTVLLVVLALVVCAVSAVVAYLLVPPSTREVPAAAPRADAAVQKLTVAPPSDAATPDAATPDAATPDAAMPRTITPPPQPRPHAVARDAAVDAPF